MSHQTASPLGSWVANDHEVVAKFDDLSAGADDRVLPYQIVRVRVDAQPIRLSRKDATR